MRCLVCGEYGRTIAESVIAPFISELVGIRLGTRSQLSECTVCAFRWYSYRYSDSENKLLYEGYRAGEYFKIRKRWEPWYSNSVNNAYKGNVANVDSRVVFMTNILRPFFSNVEVVLDIGGDEGQFFPNLPIRRKIVVDLSNVDLRPGVERVHNVQEEVGEPIQLVIAAHILEHVSRPREFLIDLISHLEVGSGLIYVEVPLDNPKLSGKFSRTVNSKILRLATIHRISILLLDFSTGLRRNFRIPLSSFSLLKQSEHINYFDFESITALFKSVGLEILAHDRRDDEKVGHVRLGKLGVLARRVRIA
jgi:hypothetical protein